MIVLSVVALGLLGVIIWLVRENRRLTQMVISRHTGDFTAMVRAEKKQLIATKDKKKDDGYSSWRIPSEGVAP
jgi:hypothetical protein